MIKGAEEKNVDVDDSEDLSNFFLQPASSPYNITKKVEEANMELFNSNAVSKKSPKVKFKDDLVTFDDQLTDDDVVSIESDGVEEISPSIIEDVDTSCGLAQIFEYKTQDDLSDIESEDEDEIIEEIECEIENAKKEENLVSKEIMELEKLRKSQNSANKINQPILKPKKTKKLKHVNCKHHCVEKIDFDLSKSIKKLSIKEKPMCPPLKLIERKCCKENAIKNSTNLPNYTGLRSEYGLSRHQMEKREKLKEIQRLQKEKRQFFLRQYEKQKNEINEEIFRAWLKEVQYRKMQNFTSNSARNRRQKINLNPHAVHFPKEENLPIHSKIVNEFKPKLKNTPRRPSSSHSVFIEVPQRILSKGINLDNILNGYSSYPKKLYITTRA